jgi:hypothetical protein
MVLLACYMRGSSVKKSFFAGSNNHKCGVKSKKFHFFLHISKKSSNFAAAKCGYATIMAERGLTK